VYGAGWSTASDHSPASILAIESVLRRRRFTSGADAADLSNLSHGLSHETGFTAHHH